MLTDRLGFNPSSATPWLTLGRDSTSLSLSFLSGKEGGLLAPTRRVTGSTDSTVRCMLCSGWCSQCFNLRTILQGRYHYHSHSLRGNWDSEVAQCSAAGTQQSQDWNPDLQLPKPHF